MSVALNGQPKVTHHQKYVENVNLITGINLNLNGVYKMSDDLLIGIGGYKIYYDKRNYIVRRNKAKEEARGGFFTTLYGAINYISEGMLKEKISSPDISKIDDLKVAIKEHNKDMLDFASEIDRSLRQ